MAMQAAPASTPSLEAPYSPTETLLNGTSSTPKAKTNLEAFQAVAIHPWENFKNWQDARKNVKKPPQKKPPYMLDYWGLSLLLAFEFSILVVITTLWALSTKYNGFAEVPDTPASIVVGSTDRRERLLWIYSLLWTFLPAFIVTMCGNLFNVALQALKDTQPMIELRQQGNASSRNSSAPGRIASFLSPFQKTNTLPRIEEKAKAKHTILLDYNRDWFPFVDSYHAYHNKHYLISACTVVKWLFAAIGPLAAAIISVGNVSSSKAIEVTTSTQFDPFKNESSSRLAMDSASAILLNGATPHPWSTELYSVTPFSVHSDLPGNLTADADTYSGTLNCVLIDIDSLVSAGNVTVDYQNITTFTFVDRECIASPYIVVTPLPPQFALTYYQNCSYETLEMRLILMTGNYDPTSEYLLSNVSVLSCVPMFHHLTARVSVPVGTNGLENTGHILNIVPLFNVGANPYWPAFVHEWVQKLPDLVLGDPDQVLEADNFGFMTYQYAMKLNETTNLARAMNHTFSVLYATFATVSTYDALPKNITSTGMLSRPVNRLFVVFLPATIVTVVVALSLLVTIWIAFHAYRCRETLKEHTDLILGHAILLQENEGVNDYIKAVRADFKTQAEKAAEAIRNKQARKTGEDASSGHPDLRMKHLVSHGDLVQFAEENPKLRKWKCSVDNNGKLKMEKPIDLDNSA